MCHFLELLTNGMICDILFSIMKINKIFGVLTKIAIYGFALIGLFGVSITCLIIFSPKETKYNFTGQEFLESINEYRRENNLQELRIEPKLCNNLTERWLAIKNPDNGHKGLNEWLESNYLVKDDSLIDSSFSAEFGISEINVIGAADTKEAIKALISSPGHKLILDNPKYNVICTYAAQGTAVAEIAELK